jgi:hypothetical protein
MQVCAERGAVAALPAIQALAQREGATALQISAIAALGRLGGPEQAALLRRLQAQGNQALEPAIDAALRRLEGKPVKTPPIT